MGWPALTPSFSVFLQAKKGKDLVVPEQPIGLFILITTQDSGKEVSHTVTSPKSCGLSATKNDTSLRLIITEHVSE